MNFKKTISCLLLIMSTTLVTPAFASDGEPGAKTETVRSQQLEARLTEIKNMDKSRLTKTERRNLRKEVKEIRYEQRHYGVYISVGALIIIILLLIILL